MSDISKIVATELVSETFREKILNLKQNSAVGDYFAYSFSSSFTRESIYNSTISEFKPSMPSMDDAARNMGNFSYWRDLADREKCQFFPMMLEDNMYIDRDEYLVLMKFKFIDSSWKNIIKDLWEYYHTIKDKLREGLNESASAYLEPLMSSSMANFLMPHEVLLLNDFTCLHPRTILVKASVDTSVTFTSYHQLQALEMNDLRMSSLLYYAMLHKQRGFKTDIRNSGQAFEFYNIERGESSLTERECHLRSHDDFYYLKRYFVNLIALLAKETCEKLGLSKKHL